MLDITKWQSKLAASGLDLATEPTTNGQEMLKQPCTPESNAAALAEGEKEPTTGDRAEMLGWQNRG